MRELLLTLTLVLLCVAPVAAQAPDDPLGGLDLLAWMGLEPGESRVLEGDGERQCVTVREPRAFDGRRYAELRGLRWPGRASDSRVLVPLDGAIGLDVIDTPGPRPNPRPLLPAPDSLRAGLPSGVTPQGELAGRIRPDYGGVDGWFAVPGEDGVPRLLVYRWCATCSDAGTTVVLERGKGIRVVQEITIAGSRTLEAVDDVFCAERPRTGTEFQIYVLPEESDRP